MWASVRAGPWRRAAGRAARGRGFGSCWSWPRSVDEDQARWIKPPLVFFPPAPPPGHVRPVLLAACRLFFDSDPLVLEEVPNREAAHLDPARGQLRSDRPQCQVRFLGEPSQQPLPFALQRIGAPAAHLVRRRAAGRPMPLRPLHPLARSP